MKTVEMHRDYSYRVAARAFVQYIGGETYQRVPEAAVRAIQKAGAGIVVVPDEPTSELASGGIIAGGSYGLVGE